MSPARLQAFTMRVLVGVQEQGKAYLTCVK